MAVAIEDLGVGDVVRLNSGPLRMTVDRVDDGKVVVVYDDTREGITETAFDPRMLTFVCKADPGAPRLAKK